LVSACHKRYSLATKFFEYVFEPVLAEQNSIFYGVGLHRFISNVLFFETLANNQRASVALLTFQEIIRAHDATGVARLVPSRIVEPGFSEGLADIQAFVEANQEAIAADVTSHAGDEPLYRWMLDLSVSALFALLTTWGQRREALTVYCDESKPLHESRETSVRAARWPSAKGRDVGWNRRCYGSCHGRAGDPAQKRRRVTAKTLIPPGLT